jgi:hypothetical protein
MLPLQVGAKQGKSESSLGRAEAIIEPAAHEAELPINSGLGGIQQLGGLFRRKSKEETKLDHPAFTLVQLLQFLQDAIQVHHLRWASVDPRKVSVQRDRNTAIALLSPFRTSVIHQNAAHQARGEAVKMLAIFKSEAALPNQLEEQLIDDAGRLEKIFRAFTAKKCSRNLPQLRINKLEQVLDGRRISCGPIAE